MDLIINFFLDLSGHLGYTGVLLLMTVESSFIPFPSEIIIPPAAFLASQGQGNIYLVVLFGILGSLLGAIINYLLAFYLGRTVIHRLAETRLFKILLITPAKIERAEHFFLKYGIASTLLGRLVPVIRQLISLPAGFGKMNFFKFSLFTAIGSAIWVTVLAILGFVLGSNQDLLSKYYHFISWLFIAMVILVVVLIMTIRFIKAKKTFKSKI